MLIHHSDQNYKDAAKNAVQRTADKFQQQIDKGKSLISTALTRIQNEVPTDVLTSSEKLKFRYSKEDGLEVEIPKIGLNGVHSNAFAQMAATVGINGFNEYAQNLLKKGGAFGYHAAGELNWHMAELQQRRLLRVTNGSVRGFLSDTYRPVDTRAILTAFIEEAVQRLGAQPIAVNITDVRYVIKVAYPEVLRPTDDEVLIYGIELYDSEYGRGKTGIRPFIERLWCTNFATLEETLGKIHLGAKLPDDIELSKKTYALDTAGTRSALVDVTRALFSEKRITSFLQMVKKASEDNLTWTELRPRLAKQLLKSEMQQAEKIWTSQDDQTEIIPNGHSTWSASNLLSWFAKQTDDDDRRLDLERAAGALVQRSIQ